MGDRVTVTLTFPEEHKETVFSLYDITLEDCDDFDSDLLSVDFEEVNYGNLEHLDKLQVAGIAYDSQWAQGGTFSSGMETCRYTPEGKIELKEIYDDNINPDIDTLMGLIDKSDELRALIIEHKQYSTVRSWNGQVEYGKMYQTWKLITVNI